MVSFQLESDAEVSSRSPFNFIGTSFIAMCICRGLGQELVLLFRINIVAVDRMLPRVLALDTFFFENHLVVELLWPRRERRARRITVALSNIFNVLSKSCKSEVAPFNVIGTSFVAMCICRGFSDCRVFSLRSFNLMINIMDVKTMLWYDFVSSSLVFHGEMLFINECTRSEVAPFNFIGPCFVAMCICRGFSDCRVFSLRCCYAHF